jgi:hypothetical protein
MKNLEEAVAENAKGILASTMSQEIKELVKESLTEADDEIENDVDVEDPESDDIANIEFGDEDDEEEGDDTDIDNIDLGIGDDDEEDDEDDLEDLEDDDEDEEDTIDLTDVDDDEEILRVFQLMGPDDNIVVTKDDKGNTHLKDEETGKEYMIVGESEENEGEMFEDMYKGDDMNMMDEEWNEGDEIYEEMEEEESIESIVGRMFGSDEDEDDGLGIPDDMPSYKTKWHSSKDTYDELEEIVYEIEMDEDDMDEQSEDPIFESKKMSVKPKGVGMGKPKFSYGSNPNQGKGFNTKMKQGPRTMGTGTGKPKFEFPEGENSGDKLGKNKMVKKVETKEASRTLGNGSNFRKGGLPKPKAHSSFNTAIKENTTNKEVQILREKNEEYRKALNIFRSKLNEVAVFNSNLAYATRLFTEHSTSKQEKINILRRFDGVETIKESKNLYQSLKNELSAGTKSQPMNESLENKIAKAPATGSAVNLIESKTYENPQFLRMKDLMAKLK